MKWLRFLRRSKDKRPLPTIQTVQSPGQARAARIAREAKQAHAADLDRERRQLRNTPRPDEIDPIFADTGSLELSREAVEGDNPYDTHTWRQENDGELRRVDDSHAIRNKSDKTPRKAKDQTNPYDTIVGRKGW